MIMDRVGMGTISAPWASTQARDNWAGVHPLALAIAVSFSAKTEFCLKFSNERAKYFFVTYVTST
jgi:hypothetical protein